MLLFSRQVVSDSLQPHGLQHSRLLCPSPSPRVAQTHVYWCHPTISSSVLPFSPSLCMGRSRVLAQWNHSFDMHLLSRASILCFHIVNFLRPHSEEWLQSEDRNSFLPEFPQGSPAHNHGGCKCWWLGHLSFTDAAGKIPFLTNYWSEALNEKMGGFTLNGVQNEAPLNVPLCHVGYFELKTFKTQKTQTEPFTSPSPA